MKVIVAGSRWFTEKDIVYEILDNSPWPITQVIHGGQRGVDKIAGKWAEENDIPVRVFPYPSQFGVRGGPIRNSQMADVGDALIAIMFDSSKGISKGTPSMVKIALAKKLQIFVVNINSLREYVPESIEGLEE